MAVVKTNQETKAKIVYQMPGEGSETVQTSRTFSNLVANVTGAHPCTQG